MDAPRFHATKHSLLPSQKRAAFCDLGKAIASETHTDTNLANWYFLPPELEEGRNHEYNHQLDVWMLALALLRTWWMPAFRVQSGSRDLRPRIPEDYCTICESLKQDTMSGFADLLLGMFQWDPQSRRNESQVLKELSYRLPTPGSPGSSERKRSKVPFNT